jgi:V8-like Glu-specific endopeptidase
LCYTVGASVFAWVFLVARDLISTNTLKENKMFRKFNFFLFVLLLSSIFCLTNTFAEENRDLIDLENAIAAGNFEFRMPDGAAYIQDTPDFQRTPESIIGTNDFEKMRDLPPESQDYILGTKVGWFVVPSRFDPDRFWICTGFLVGPDLFMTNHHCIYDEFGPLPFQDAAILMDYYQEPDVDRTRGGITARVAEVLKADPIKDYALLRLDKPIGDTYGWLELDTTTRVDASQSVKLISHPDGRSKEIVRRNTEIADLPAAFTDEFPFMLAYFADSEGGSSGAPVFLREGTGVIAIHHSAWTRRDTGEPLFNAGSLMSYIVPEIKQYLPDSVPEPPVPGPMIAFNPPTIANQTFTLNSPVTLTLPTATGGTPPYSYTLAPIPAGLVFTPAVHSLAGVPTIEGVTHVTYTATDTTSDAVSLNFTITVLEEGVPVEDPLDVNSDGLVNVIDLAIVALFYGTQVPAGMSLPADVNADGSVNLSDLTAVAQGIDAAGNAGTLSADDVEAVLEAVEEQADAIEAAPGAPGRFSTAQHARFSQIAARNVATAFEATKHQVTNDARLRKWMPLLKDLQQLLTEMREVPNATALLPNYPNPFNPETWIPYHLSKDAEVTLMIHDVHGVAVRTLTLGHQPAGIYKSRGRAAYWDGKNALGESVASGVYFYTLTAGDFNATRKLLIIK